MGIVPSVSPCTRGRGSSGLRVRSGRHWVHGCRACGADLPGRTACAVWTWSPSSVGRCARGECGDRSRLPSASRGSESCQHVRVVHSADRPPIRVSVVGYQDDKSTWYPLSWNTVMALSPMRRGIPFSNGPSRDRHPLPTHFSARPPARHPSQRPCDGSAHSCFTLTTSVGSTVRLSLARNTVDIPVSSCCPVRARVYLACPKSARRPRRRVHEVRARSSDV